jgi:hypothetical protein
LTARIIWEKLIKSDDQEIMDEPFSAKMTRLLLRGSRGIEFDDDVRFRFKAPVWNSNLYCLESYGATDDSTHGNSSVQNHSNKISPVRS